MLWFVLQVSCFLVHFVNLFGNLKWSAFNAVRNRGFHSHAALEKRKQQNAKGQDNSFSFEFLKDKEPEWTHMTGQLTTDYIWVSPKYLRVSGVLKAPDKPVPDEALVNEKRKCTPLFASNHLPIAARLHFR